MAKTLDEAIDEVVAELPDNSDLEPDTPDTDDIEDLDDDEDVDEPEDEDLEEDLEDGPSDEDDVEGDEEDEDEDDAPEDAIELSDDDEVVLPDGSVVKVKDAALRHADYTRKTQELAEQKRQLESEAASWQAEREELLSVQDQFAGWLEEKTADPAGWAREVVEESPNPTQTLAQAIVDLNAQGLLDPAFAEQFKLDVPDTAVHAAAGGKAESDRIAQLEAKIEELTQPVQEQEQKRQIVSRMFDQWEELKLQQGLTFDSDEEEHEARRDTMKFAIENGLVDRIGIAHDALNARTQTTSKSPRTNQVPDKKKRATRAVSNRSSGSSRRPAPKKAKTVEGAAELAVESWISGG